MVTTSQQQQQPTITDILADEELFFQYFTLITDKQGNRVPLRLTPAQKYMHDRKTGRDIILKPRQIGSTTYWAGTGFYDLAVEENRNIVLMAHKGEVTERMLHRARMMYEWWVIPANKKPRLSHDAANQLYVPSRNNRFFIETAGARVSGRGDTIHRLICSELAFWQDAFPGARKIFEAAEQSVPLSGEIVIESTPNGEGKPEEPNIFFEKVQEALSGDSYWKLIEIPWWFVPEYRISRGSRDALPSDRAVLSFNNEEQELIVRAGWSDEEAEDRIRFRRRKLKELKGLFVQEYYEDIASCFYVAGESFYDFDETEKLRISCFEPRWHNYGAEIWYLPQKSMGAMEVVEFIKQNPGADPLAVDGLDANYTITVDPGQGKKTRSVAQVWRMDINDYQQVRHEATLSGMYEPSVFAPMVRALAGYYNNAKIIPESNGHGMSFCALIADWHNLYYRTDPVGGLIGKQVGWYTSGGTGIGKSGSKMFAISELQQLINQGKLITHDINLVRELRQWRYAGMDINTIGSDDHHDAAMIMAATRSVVNFQPRGFRGRAGFNW